PDPPITWPPDPPATQVVAPVTVRLSPPISRVVPAEPPWTASEARVRADPVLKLVVLLPLSPTVTAPSDGSTSPGLRLSVSDARTLREGTDGPLSAAWKLTVPEPLWRVIAPLIVSPLPKSAEPPVPVSPPVMFTTDPAARESVPPPSCRVPAP